MQRSNKSITTSTWPEPHLSLHFWFDGKLVYTIKQKLEILGYICTWMKATQQRALMVECLLDLLYGSKFLYYIKIEW